MSIGKTTPGQAAPGQRWVLFVNIPIGVAATAAALAWLTESQGRQEAGQPRSRLDVAGAVAVTAGLGTLVYAIVGTQTHPWGSGTTLSLLGVAAVLLAGFAVIELRLASAPLMRFGLLRSRSVSAPVRVHLWRRGIHRDLPAARLISSRTQARASGPRPRRSPHMQKAPLCSRKGLLSW